MQNRDRYNPATTSHDWTLPHTETETLLRNMENNLTIRAGSLQASLQMLQTKMQSTVAVSSSQLAADTRKESSSMTTYVYDFKLLATFLNDLFSQYRTCGNGVPPRISSGGEIEQFPSFSNVELIHWFAQSFFSTQFVQIAEEDVKANFSSSLLSLQLSRTVWIYFALTGSLALLVLTYWCTCTAHSLSLLPLRPTRSKG